MGQVLPGDEINYLRIPSSVIASGTTGTSAMVVVRVYPSEFVAGKKNYILKGEPVLKFLSISCDATDDNKLKVDWYPNGDTVPVEKNTQIVCPNG